MQDASGGILADDMGLGKTLIMLAAIVGSMARAADFACRDMREPIQHWQDVKASKATLVIVPSAQVYFLTLHPGLAHNPRHIEPGTIRTHRFHGGGKGIGVAELQQYNLVLTTYASVAADFCRGRSILHHIHWFRVILDEGNLARMQTFALADLQAHFVRNAATKQFRAIHALSASIRWCLTGTPIQNSLEDLGALVKFLKVPILDDLAIFRRHVIMPIVSTASARYTNLRRLLEALCLRRTKSLLNLPEPVIDTHFLELCPEERLKYDDYGEYCKHSINMAISGHSLKKANQHVIQAILGMRLFCNDGEGALIKRMYASGLPPNPEEALSYLQASANSSCVQCGSEILNMYQDGDLSSGRLTICQHLICGECLPLYESDLDGSQEGGRSQCPICGLRGDRSTFISRPAASTEIVRSSDGMYPTKLQALLRNVQSQEANGKCVIFSFWKTTLDIVAQMFDNNELPYYRIHGQIPASKRSKTLIDFESSSNVRILLITLGTGAVGLNKLKVANHIHIMEPQWNPSVESQAIGRVLRFGQEKAVKVIRYIMKDTVEEAVQSRQLRKLQLLRGGFGLVKDEHTSRRVEEIMVRGTCQP
ncbi:hypothetical protein EK21DRAFT_96193 [Setomelanomma holmii]|uniref:Uncharacterized protein n=1 Tax=Setomelanomma holmii TaxID=210430 RepID=A0A9P4LSB8_9PLEO|nr:hypothetical protein EK21DRAFT_96193 [Setomelanomma holmii]